MFKFDFFRFALSKAAFLAAFLDLTAIVTQPTL